MRLLPWVASAAEPQTAELRSATEPQTAMTLRPVALPSMHGGASDGGAMQRNRASDGSDVARGPLSRTIIMTVGWVGAPRA